MVKAIEFMNSTKTARYRPADVAKNEGCIGNWRRCSISLFIRQVSSLETMAKAAKLADVVDETLGQRRFLGTHREYFYRKGAAYGRSGRATDAFKNWLQNAGDPWIEESSPASSTTVSRKRSRRSPTEREQSVDEERHVRRRRSEDLSPEPRPVSYTVDN